MVLKKEYNNKHACLNISFKIIIKQEKETKSSFYLLVIVIYFNETFLDLVNTISADFLVARNEIYASFLARWHLSGKDWFKKT